jgi:uncharacterized protein
MLRLFYSILVFFAAIFICHGQYTISDLPSPKQHGQDYFVSNPDGIISSSTMDSLNRMAVQIEKQSSAEVAIVIINDFYGQDDFEYALEVFNTWGIGKDANDNGILLLIARDRRIYRFITGYGVEGLLPDALLKRIGENYLVPYFKENDYDGGVLAAMNVIREVLLSPEGAEELRAKLREQSFFVRHQSNLIFSLLAILLTYGVLRWNTHVVEKKVLAGKRNVKFSSIFQPLAGGCGCVLLILFISIFVVGFSGVDPKILVDMDWIPWYLTLGGSLAVLVKYNQGATYIKKSFRDEKNRLNGLAEYHRQMIIPLILSPLALFSVMAYSKRKKEMSSRFLPPDNSGDWLRLDRDELRKKTKHLNQGQLREERELSRSYEIWEKKTTGEIKVVAWKGILGKDFSECPKCGYQTFEKPAVKTIKAATYKVSGTGEKIQKCVNCSFVLSLGEVIIPKKIKSSSSSSGGGSSSGGSRSGSFGGGSSGGGAAGGSW